MKYIDLLNKVENDFNNKKFEMVKIGLRVLKKEFIYNFQDKEIKD